MEKYKDDLYWEHIDLHSSKAGLFTKNFKKGDKITWLGHDGVYGFMYGWEFVAEQETVDKKGDFPFWKKVGTLDLVKDLGYKIFNR